MTGVCFLDIRKCFDSIDHELLKLKLSYYGIQQKELEWFSNYLNDRSQVVCYANSISDVQNLDVGVPQGSVLGPILFTIFINDVTQYVAEGTCNLYADDTVVYFQGKSCADINTSLQICIDQLSVWYKNNNLSLNASKCEVMLISSQRRFISDSLCINLDGQQLNNVSCANYLGMKIDKNVNWNVYVKKLCSNVYLKLKQLRRLVDVVSPELLSKIYSSTIQPCIDYAISVWGQTTDQILLKYKDYKTLLRGL